MTSRDESMVTPHNSMACTTVRHPTSRLRAFRFVRLGWNILTALFVVTHAQGQGYSIFSAADDFSYTNGTLAGNNGGSGWAAAWANQAGAPTVASQQALINSSANQEAVRVLSVPQLKWFGGTVWIQFSAQQFTSATGSTTTFGGLGLFKGATEKLLIGKRWPGNYVWGAGTGANVVTSTNSTLLPSVIYARIQYGPSGNDQLDVWINPTNSLISIISNLPPSLSWTGADLSFDRIRLRGGVSGSMTESWQFDNIVLSNLSSAVVEALPGPIFDKNPGFVDLYYKAWELAYDHITSGPGLPQTPYIDEAFWANTIWIWDTCFMSMFCKYSPNVFPGVESLNNFYVPLLTNTYSSGTYPLIIQHPDNPPLFAWVEYDNYRMLNDTNHVNDLIEQTQYLQRHYTWFDTVATGWSLHSQPGWSVGTVIDKGDVGYRWGGVQSGMDNTPRQGGFWIDAIAQQGLSALYISRLAASAGDATLSSNWLAKYQGIKDTVNQYYWNEADGIYYDIDPTTRAHLKVKTPASFWPMLAEMCSPAQAAKMVNLITDTNIFGGERPWPTVARNDSTFTTPDGNYWRGAVWLPTAYMATKALEKYGCYAEADQAAESLLTHMLNTYNEYSPATIWECYSPTRNRPADHSGVLVRSNFCGWSALGPISMFIENVLGLHVVDGVENRVEWRLYQPGRQGISRLRFGTITTDILFDGDQTITVNSSGPYTLVINSVTNQISAGTNTFTVFDASAPLTWDADGVSGGSIGGSGNWNITDKLWDNAGTMVNWNSAAQYSALFGGTPGVVTVHTAPGVLGDYIGADSIVFNTPGYVMGGDGNLTANTLAGAGNFTKQGSGDLKLLGNSPYSGALTLGGGLLELADGAKLTNAASLTSAGGGDIVSGSSYPLLNLTRGGTLYLRDTGDSAIGNLPVILNNGSILWFPNTNGSYSKTLPSVSLSGGFNSLAVAPYADVTTMAIGNLTRSNGASVEFRTARDVLGAGQSRIQVTNLNGAPVANTNGILGGWALVAQSPGANNAFPARSFAGWNGSSIIAATPDKANGTSGGTANTQDIATGTSTENWLANSTSGNRTIAANVTINSLIEQQDLSINSGATLTLASGGLILRSNNFWMQTVTGGVGYLTSGNNDFYLQADGGGGDQAIKVVIKDGSAGAVTLRKSGAGLVKLSQTNTYSGGTVVNQGTLDLQRGGGTACIRGLVTINPGGMVKMSATNTLGYTSTVLAVTNVNVNGGTLDNAAANDQGYYTAYNLTGGTMTSSGGGNYVFGSSPECAIKSLASPIVSTISAPIWIRDTLTNLPIVTEKAAVSGGVDLEILGRISGSAGRGIAKSGPGCLLLSSSNLFSGSTIVSGGTLEAVGIDGTLRNSTNFVVSSNGTLKLNGRNIFTYDHATAMANSRVITVENATVLMESNCETRFGNVMLRNGATWTCNRGVAGYDALLANTDMGMATVLVTNTSGAMPATMNGSGGIHLQGAQNFDVADATGDSTGDLNVSMILAGPGSSGGAAGGINKLGAGTMTLSAANTYTGATTVNGGQLHVNGSLAATPTIINASGTLAGNGVIAGPVTVNAGGTLSPGSSIGTLTVSNNLNLSGTTLAEVSLTGGVANDLVVVTGNANYGGTLVVTNIGAGALTNGAVFHLFTVSGSKSNNFTGVTVLPSTGLTGAFDPATGNVALSGNVTPPPTLQFTSVSNGVYQLSWNGSFRLQYQTNSLSIGLSANWSNYSDLSNPVNITNNLGTPAIFYRLVSAP